MIILIAIFSAFFVAYANGSNDNFKGVATLFGGRILNYKKALSWATLTTFLGSLVSFFLGARLIKLFSGKGIVMDSAVSDPAFMLSIALGAAITIMFATLIGMPISTTHSLIGGIAGAGIAGESILSFSVFGKSFFLPLIAGPIFALVLTIFLYASFHQLRVLFNVEKSTCLCIGNRQVAVLGTPGLYVFQSTGLAVTLDDQKYCRNVYAGKMFGINISRVVDFAHIVSSGAVSFARGLNDTPKIAALLMIQAVLSLRLSLFFIAVLMGIGGLIHSGKIAKKMGMDISEMNSGQAFTGNFVTSILVILGSILGFPLSTTHVSCGAIFGIGTVTRKAHTGTILQIVLAWIVTLPLAALLSALIWKILH